MKKSNIFLVTWLTWVHLFKLVIVCLRNQPMANVHPYRALCLCGSYDDISLVHLFLFFVFNFL